MPQDAYTLKILTNDLNAVLAGGKVNKITQPDGNEVYMNIYADRKNYRLVISASVSSARVCTSSDERDNPLTALNFCMLLRKHLLGATVNKIELDGFDRVVKITFSTLGDFFESEEKILYAEIMGKYSNVILTANGKILGALKTAGIEEASLRPLITGMAYTSPPQQDKLAPTDLKLKNLCDNCNAFNKGEFLFENVKGLSKQTADEIAYNYPNDLYNGLQTFLNGNDYSPCVGFLNGKLVDFFAKEYKSLALEYKKFDTLLQAEEYYFYHKEKAKRFNELKTKLFESVKKEEKKFEKRLKIILEKQLDCKNLENDRVKGELIISNIYKIKKGDKTLTTLNYYDGSEVTITLDENLSPQDNAQKFFKRYNKQKRTLVAVEPQKKQVEEELEYVKSLYAEIDRAETVEDLSVIEEELKTQGYIKKQSAKKKKAEVKKYLEYEVEGFLIKVGRNNVENDELTFSARGKDIWLHTKTYHSSHVIVETCGRTVPDKVLTVAAEICAYYSAGKNGAKIEVDYTEKRFVKKPKGAKPGFVIYTDFKTLVVNPLKREEFLKYK